MELVGVDQSTVDVEYHCAQCHARDRRWSEWQRERTICRSGPPWPHFAFQRGRADTGGPPKRGMVNPCRAKERSCLYSSRPMLHYFKFRQDLYAPVVAKDVYVKRG